MAKILKGDYLYMITSYDRKDFIFSDLYKEAFENKLIKTGYVDSDDDYKIKLLFHTSNVANFKKI
jgi:hypothetical protein